METTERIRLQQIEMQDAEREGSLGRWGELHGYPVEAEDFRKPKGGTMKAELPAITGGESNLPSVAIQKQMADNQIELATHWAKRLMEVVRSCKMSKRVAGKEYLQVEAWLVIAEFAHCRAVAQEAKPWLDEKGELIGYTVRAVVLDAQGIEVGAGESSCGFDAFPCRGRQGSEQDKAAKGAAQTWAISRALSNRFRYVALMAGFSPTPAEEMHGTPDQGDTGPYPVSPPPRDPSDKPDLLTICPIHDVEWKNGQWGRFHTIKATKETCSLKKILSTMIGGYSKQLGIGDELALQAWLAEHQFAHWKDLPEEAKVQAVDLMAAAMAEKLDKDDVPA